MTYSINAEVLFDSIIEFDINKQNCSLHEFCSKYLDDIDIEKFIQNEIKEDYVIVSLDECIDIALKNNFNIAIKDHDFKSSKYLYKYSLTNFMPIFKTESYISEYSGQILVGGVLRDVFHETALSINMKIEHRLTDGGRQIFEAKASKYFSRAKKHESNFTISETIFYSSKYYYEMLLAKLNIEIYLRNLIERNAQLALSKSLEKSGFGTKFDVIRSQNESAQAKISLINAFRDFKLSQTRLCNIMGIDLNIHLMPFEDEINLINLVETNTDLETLFNLAIQSREDLKQIRDEILYQKQIKYKYITDYLPRLYVSYQQQFQGTLSSSVNPSYILSGYLTWAPGENTILGTLFKIKAQKEVINSAKLTLENTVRNIKESIINSIYKSSYNYKKVQVAKERVEFSNAGIKLAMLRFNNGKGILLDVIQAQSEVTQARVEYVNSIIMYNISQLELAFNTGTIGREMIFKNYNP